LHAFAGSSGLISSAGQQVKTRRKSAAFPPFIARSRVKVRQTEIRRSIGRNKAEFFAGNFRGDDVCLALAGKKMLMLFFQKGELLMYSCEIPFAAHFTL